MSNPPFKKLLKTQMTRKEFLGLSVFALASVFGIVGILEELKSHAATPFLSEEAESGTVTSPATTITDTTASGGKAVKFMANAPTPTPTPAQTWLASGATSKTIFTPSGLSTSTSADNTGAIQNAINSANSAGGGIVQLPPGTYYINGHVLLKSNVALVGSGPGLTPTTSLKAGSGFYNAQGPNGGYPIITTNGASNVTISNLIADGSSNQHQGIGGQRLSGYTVDVRNSTNALVSYVTVLLTISYQIVACGSTKFSFVHNTIKNATNGYDQCDGIHILDSNTGQVLHNSIDNRIGNAGDDGTVAHTINAEVYGVEYGWNLVRAGNNGGGMQLAVGNFAIHDLNIHDNEYYDSPYGIRSGGYDNHNGAQYNIAVTRCNIHDVRGGTDFSDGSGPSCSIGDFYVASGSCSGNSISNIRVCNFNTQPQISGGTITNVTGCSAASPVVGTLGA